MLDFIFLCTIHWENHDPSWNNKPESCIHLEVSSCPPELEQGEPTSPCQTSYHIPFKTEEEMEKNPHTTAQQCLQTFIQKGGILQSIPHLSETNEPVIRLQIGDAVYPICTGGWCRSQTLWTVLKPFSDKIVLFPPHAARVGWDPYNGRINRYRNYDNEALYDEFYLCFGIDRAPRFGFENTAHWSAVELVPTREGIKAIEEFYDRHYFGPESSWQDKKGKRRIYITFSKNAHVILHRLNQTNDNLYNVTVVAIDSEDIITSPPPFLYTLPRSVKAYDYFATLLTQVLDLSDLILFSSSIKQE